MTPEWPRSDPRGKGSAVRGKATVASIKLPKSLDEESIPSAGKVDRPPAKAGLYHKAEGMSSIKMRKMFGRRGRSRESGFRIQEECGSDEAKKGNGKSSFVICHLSFVFWHLGGGCGLLFVAGGGSFVGGSSYLAGRREKRFQPRCVFNGCSQTRRRSHPAVGDWATSCPPSLTRPGPGQTPCHR